MAKQGYVKFIENSKLTLIDDMHLSCFSWCFNLRSTVNKEVNCVTVAKTSVSTAAINRKLLT